MSRIGKKAVPVPAGVTATVDGRDHQREGAEGHPDDADARRDQLT